MRQILQLDVFYGVDGIERVSFEKLRCYRDILQVFLQLCVHHFFIRILQEGFGGQDFG